MRTFLISYDLATPHRNKHVLATAIMALGQSWARPLEQTWYVRADQDECHIERKLAAFLDSDDGLIVQAVADDAILTNTSLRWFRQRRSEVEAAENIIAFPAPPAPPAAQSELPFAEAC
jgi:hypothetical protein